MFVRMYMCLSTSNFFLVLLASVSMLIHFEHVLSATFLAVIDLYNQDVGECHVCVLTLMIACFLHVQCTGSVKIRHTLCGYFLIIFALPEG